MQKKFACMHAFWWTVLSASLLFRFHLTLRCRGHTRAVVYGTPMATTFDTLKKGTFDEEILAEIVR